MHSCNTNFKLETGKFWCFFKETQQILLSALVVFFCQKNRNEQTRIFKSFKSLRFILHFHFALLDFGRRVHLTMHYLFSSSSFPPPNQTDYLRHTACDSNLFPSAGSGRHERLASQRPGREGAVTNSCQAARNCCRPSFPEWQGQHDPHDNPHAPTCSPGKGGAAGVRSIPVIGGVLLPLPRCCCPCISETSMDFFPSPKIKYLQRRA